MSAVYDQGSAAYDIRYSFVTEGGNNFANFYTDLTAWEEDTVGPKKSWADALDNSEVPEDLILHSDTARINTIKFNCGIFSGDSKSSYIITFTPNPSVASVSHQKCLSESLFQAIEATDLLRLAHPITGERVLHDERPTKLSIGKVNFNISYGGLTEVDHDGQKVVGEAVSWRLEGVDRPIRKVLHPYPSDTTALECHGGQIHVPIITMPVS